MVRSFLAPLIIVSLAVVLFAGPQETGEAIDTQRSSITIHVGKSGVFAGAAHEHWVNAPIATGMVDVAPSNPSVRFTVEASKLSVRTEKTVSDRDQAVAQFSMQSKVLESNRYPEIVFHTTRVQRYGENSWKVFGDLTLHGTTKSIMVSVVREKGAYVGDVRIKQTEFGIHPIKIGGGLVKVQDELDISFQVYTVAPSRVPR
jgi:hypothetical protein